MSKACTSATAVEKTCTTVYSDQLLGRRKDTWMKAIGGGLGSTQGKF